MNRKLKNFERHYKVAVDRWVKFDNAGEERATFAHSLKSTT